MTHSPNSDGDEWREARPPRRMIIWSSLRALGSTVALVIVYYQLPLDRSSSGAAVTMLVVALLALVGLVALQVRAIVFSPFPGLRAAEALGTSLPLFLLLFAGTYVGLAVASADAFSEPLTRTDALYFTVTVFATVGFGDISAKAEAARVVVTGQMIADLVVLEIPGSRPAYNVNDNIGVSRPYPRPLASDCVAGAQ